MSMFVRVMFRGLTCMVLCLQVMAMSHVPMVSGALVIAGFKVVCSHTMVFRGLVMMFRCLSMMIGTLF